MKSQCLKVFLSKMIKCFNFKCDNDCEICLFVFHTLGKDDRCNVCLKMFDWFFDNEDKYKS